MGVDNTILGQTSEFKYTMKARDPENESFPASGVYSGYFFYKTNVPRRVYERDLLLDFTPFEGRFQVVGKGTNEFGSFTVVGMFDPSTKDLTCVKEYSYSFGLSLRYKPKQPAKRKTKKQPAKTSVKKEPAAKPSDNTAKTAGPNEGAQSGNELQSCDMILQKLIVELGR